MYIALLAMRNTSTPRSGRDRWALWMTAGMSTVVGSVAAILITALATTTTLDDRLRAQQQRWWICAAAGAVVLVLFVLERRDRYVWPEAVLAAGASTAIATAAHYLYARLAGHPAEPGATVTDYGVAVIWLFYFVVLAATILVPITVRSPTTKPDRAPRTGQTVVSTAALTGLAAAVIFAVGVPGGFYTNPNSAGPTPSARPSLPSPTPTAVGAARQTLTDGQALVVTEVGARVLPDNWQATRSGKPGGSGLASGDISPATCRPLAAETFISMAESHVRSSASSLFTTKPTATGVTSSQLNITVYSYDVPMADAIIGAAAKAANDCDRFTADNGRISVDFVVQRVDPPVLGERSWRYNAAITTAAQNAVITASTAIVLVGVGNTLVVAHMTAVVEPIDEQVLGRVLAESVRTLSAMP